MKPNEHANQQHETEATNAYTHDTNAHNDNKEYKQPIYTVYNHSLYMVHNPLTGMTLVWHKHHETSADEKEPITDTTIPTEPALPCLSDDVEMLHAHIGRFGVPVKQIKRLRDEQDEDEHDIQQLKKVRAEWEQQVMVAMPSKGRRKAKPVRRPSRALIQGITIDQTNKQEHETASTNEHHPHPHEQKQHEGRAHGEVTKAQQSIEIISSQLVRARDDCDFDEHDGSEFDIPWLM